MIFRGIIPDTLQVLHRCDNRACVNPDHLFLGTQKDNIRDMMAKGREGFKPPRCLGSRHGSAKVTEDDVRAIRQSTLSTRELAGQYGLSWNVVRKIRIHQIWKHVE